jgi:uncharacterized Tic20 family protein
MTDPIPSDVNPAAPQPQAQAVPGPAPLSAGDERTWAMLAHLSVLLNLVTGFLGPVAALIVYFFYKDRSRYVAYHAMQSFVFQLIWWAAPGALIGVMWAATGILSALLIGLLCLPFALILTPLIALMPLAALAYGAWGAIETSQGKDFKYWLVGDWVRGTLTG